MLKKCQQMLKKSYFYQYLQDCYFKERSFWTDCYIFMASNHATTVKNVFAVYPVELWGKHKEENTVEHCAPKNKIALLKSHLWAVIVSLNTSNTVREVEYSCHHDF